MFLTFNKKIHNMRGGIIISRWYYKPTKIVTMDKKIDYIMCIDENGSNSNLIHVLKQIKNKKNILDDDRYFTITGCIFTKKSYMDSEKIIKKLKSKYWEQGVYYDEKTNIKRMVCFHSRDIRKCNNCFSNNIIDYDNFIVDLSNTMKMINCRIVSITIDLFDYIKKGYTHDVYNVSFDLLLERYIYTTNNHKKGIILLESRGKKEDNILLQHISKVINISGTKTISSNELKNKIKGVYFNPK